MQSVLHLDNSEKMLIEDNNAISKQNLDKKALFASGFAIEIEDEEDLVIKVEDKE